MKKTPLLLYLLLIWVKSSVGQDLTPLSVPVFKPGEQLSYKLKYGFFTGAEATIRVEDSEKNFNGYPAFHIIVDGKTAGTFDVFYKVRNRYESYIDKTTLLPYYYSENRHEAGYKHTDHVTFDYQTRKIKANKGVYPFKGNVFDFVSAYYFARSIDITKIKPGDKFALRYFLDDGIYSLNITYVGKEKVDSDIGDFNCLKFSPTIIPGRIFKKSSKLYLWITDDSNRIPVKAHVDLIVGSVTMQLSAAKNLKYPLNPLVK